MVSFTNQFPDLDCGYEENGIWKKPISLNELAVYKEITPDPRILRLEGVESDEFLLLEYHANGDLWNYLLCNNPPLHTRIGWALEIAEGIAHVHSKSVVWADGYFRNVLVTEDLHVVLADFAFSLIKPDDFHWFTTQPPPIFCCPVGYYGPVPQRVDIFSFGVMLFGLLANRFPWTADLTAGISEQKMAAQCLSEGNFDTLEDEELNTHFGHIVQRCLNVKYKTGADLLEAMTHACANWRQDQTHKYDTRA